MKRIKYPTKEILNKYLNYNPITGIFTWKERQESDFNNNKKNGNACFTWNTRFKNKKAGCINRGYIIIRLNNTNYQAHKLAYIFMNGNNEEYDDIDHINKNPTDNRICNLRPVTRSQNMQNSNIQKNNTSGITGISFNKNKNKWEAYIKLNKKRYNLGIYSTLLEAAQKRYQAEKEYGFHIFNKLTSAYYYLMKHNSL